MKCYSRSTLGVIIGGITILFYLASAVFVTELIYASNLSNKAQIIRQTNNFSLTREETIAWRTFLLSTIISVCMVMIIISGLLIVGIVKRRHKLMWPWLALSGIALVGSCFRVVSSVLLGLANGMAVEGVFVLLIADVLGVGMQSLLLWPIFTLCRDIMAKNNEKPGQVMNGVQYCYVAPDAPPQYSYYDSSLPQKS